MSVTDRPSRIDGRAELHTLRSLWLAWRTEDQAVHQDKVDKNREDEEEERRPCATHILYECRCLFWVDLRERRRTFIHFFFSKLRTYDSDNPDKESVENRDERGR